MATHQHPELYFHVGLGRTGTTFLQEAVFPKFKDIYYINKKGYKRIDEIIESTNAEKYLHSHEFSKKLIEEMRRFSQKYPHTKIILVLRRHDKWMASHYKRNIKNGMPANFDAYLDLDSDQGFWKQEDVFYMPKIKCIESCFNPKPLILFHHELKEDPQQFVQKILDYTGVKETGPISYAPVHTSYSDKQLKARRWFSQKTPLKELGVKNRKFRQLRRWYNKSIRYSILALSRIMPLNSESSEPLIPTEQLQRIREFYQDDWEQALQYARENNPL